jgi:Fe/S biogenesis protein NfuA
MIEIDAPARQYFHKIVDQQGIPGLGIRLTAVKPGTPAGDCRLEFCEPAEVRDDDLTFECDGFSLFVDALSAPYLSELNITFGEERTGGQLTIRAPRLKGVPPAASATLSERVRYVLDTEINPGVAGHGGKVSLVEVSDAGEVVLQFGGGCHGCGQVDVTLKHGIEKTLRDRVPEVTSVRDVTDHSSGHAPYYKRA